MDVLCGKCSNNVPVPTCTLSSLDGTLTVGPWIQRCFPEGRVTIFMNGTRSEMSLVSNALRHDNQSLSQSHLKACIHRKSFWNSNIKQLGDLFQKQKIKGSIWNLCTVYAG